jgi:hypothetical protein
LKLALDKDLFTLKILSVPMKLDALILENDTPSLSPLVDFDRMPFTENGVDINPDVPFLGSELADEPFSDEGGMLQKGCHLHWALPTVLTTTTVLTSAQRAAAQVTSAEPQFPPVPDRWLVRRVSKKLGNAWWLLESDCYSNTPNGAVLYPLRTDAQHGVKTVFLGRASRLDANQLKPPAPVSGGDGYLGYLTAVGHGDPTFHAFYPSSRSLFGLHDPEVTLQNRGDLRYDVVGWYYNGQLDHLAGTLNDLWSAASLQQLRAAAVDPSLPDARLVVAELARRFKWDLSGFASAELRADLPERMLCFASVEIAGAVNAPLPNRAASRAPSVAVASTGTEALSALLSRMVFSDRNLAGKLEEQLEALHLAALLKAQRLDLGPKFQEARHARGFTAVRGGMTWGIRQLTKEADPGAKSSSEQAFATDLPESVADLLEEMNQMQASHDAIAAELERTQSQLYSDWYKYMVSAYPVPGVAATYPLIDDIVDYVKNVGLEESNVLLARLRSMANDIEQKRALIKNHLMPGEVELMLRPGPRFWQPNEPVVMLSGYADATDRHGGSGPLPCKTFDAAASDLSNWLWNDPARALDQTQTNAGPDPRARGLTVTDGEPGHPFLLEWEVEIFPVKPGSNLESVDRRYSKDYLSASFTFDLAKGQDLVSSQETLKAACLYNGRSILTPNASVKLRSEMEVFFRERVPANRLSAFFAQQPNTPADRVEREAWLADSWSAFAGWYLTGASSLAKSMNGNYVQRCLQGLDDMGTFYDPATGALRLAAVQVLASPPVLVEFYEDLAVTEGDATKPLPEAQGAAFVNWYRRALHFIEFLAIYRDHVDDMNHVLAQSLSGFNDALLMHRQGYQLPIAEPLGFADYQAFTMEVANALGSERLAEPQPLNSFLPLRAGLFKIHALRLVDTFGCSVMPVRDSEIDYPSTWTTSDGLCHLPPRIVQPLKLDLRWLSAQHRDNRASNDHPATSPICGWLVANELDESIAVFAADGNALGAIEDVAAGWSPAPGGGVSSLAAIDNPYLQSVVASIAAGGKTSIDSFLAILNGAVQSVAPENFEQHQAAALLMSRPFAVVRAAAGVQTRGPLAVDQSWDGLTADMTAGASIADRNRAGLEQLEVKVMLGDHAQLNDGVLGLWPELAGNQLGAYQINSDRAHPQLTLTLNHYPPQRFLVLMDPRAQMNAFTGVLPVKTIGIPAIHFTEALTRIEVTFLTTPVITGKDLIDLPLMELEGKAWSWLEKQGAVWSETATEGILRKQALLDAPELPGRGAAIWDALAASGWIVPIPDDSLRAVVAATDRRGKTAPAIDASLLPVVEQILARTHIVAPETQAAFQQENMIREGWLKLRSTEKVHA